MNKAPLPTLADVSPEYWAAPQIATGLAAGMIGLSSDQQHYLPEMAISREEFSRALAILLTSDPEQYKRSLSGKITVENGEIELTRAGKTQRLSKETELQIKDILKSKASSTAVINYPDGSSVLIKENTKIEIKDSQGRAYIKKDGSPGVAVDYLNIDIRSGKIFTALATPGATIEERQASKETLLASLNTLSYIAAAEALPPWYQSAQQKKVKVKVDMPYGVAAIRGTFISISIGSNGQCSVSCLTGSATISSQSGNSVNLGGGQSTGLQQQGAPPAPPAPMNVQEQQEFQQAREWVEQTAQEIDQNQAPPPTPPPVAGQPEQQQVQQQQPVQQPTQQQPSQILETVQNALGGSSSPSISPNSGNTSGISVTPGTTSGGGTSGGGSSGGSSNGDGGTTSDDSNPRILSITAINSSVIAGQSFAPPASVTAVMSNNTSRQVAVSWDNNSPDTGIAGVISINGTVAGYNGTVILTLSIEPPIARIDDLSINVVEGEPYELPPAVTAILSDGSTRQVSVNWDTSNFNTNQPGVVTINGIVENYSGTIKLIINVEPELSVERIENLTGRITTGESYTLPSTVNAVMSDGSNKAVNVSWNPGSVDTSQAGEYSFQGTVEDYSGTVSLILSIEPLIVIERIENLTGRITTGESYTLPSTVNAVMSDGSNKAVNVSWNPGSVDTSQAGEYSFQGTVEDYGGTVSLILTIEPIIVSIENIAPATVAYGSPFSLPFSITVHMSDGSIRSLPVTWTPASVNTFATGTYNFTGTVQGYPRTASYTLIVDALPPPPPSNQCQVTAVSSPSGASITGDSITASAANSESSLTVDVSVSPDASWKLYSDSECTSEITSKQLSLMVGDNSSYIKVTAQDNSSTHCYTLTITRAASTACAVTAVSSPSGASITGDSITASATNSESSLTVEVSVSPDASWKLYSDSECTSEITSKQLSLMVGDNSSYIKVTAQDNSSTHCYTLTITRAASTACAVTAVSSPSGASITGDSITASAANSESSLTVDVSVSPDASWKLYSDIECTSEITSKQLSLMVGDNSSYIKVTAQDNSSTHCYTLTIT
ncbi:MAG: Ig-like domain-containing protein, partial [Syntrophomonadaceae bacterium]|nr:Ig-like domain-containing protein [Syntrophomonadaceae bacterium]